MAHVFAGALEQVGRVEERSSLEEADVDVGGEGVDIGERDVTETGDRAAVVEEFADLVAAIAHDFEPLAGDGAEWAGVALEPGGDGGIAFEGAIKAEEVGAHVLEVKGRGSEGGVQGQTLRWRYESAAQGESQTLILFAIQRQEKRTLTQRKSGSRAEI